MREIKFRGKPIEDYGDVNWFYGSAVLDYEDKLAYIVSPGQGHVPVHWESVVQFTSLRDKNGKEIYEGDIVEHPEQGILEVRWHAEIGCYYLHEPRYPDPNEEDAHFIISALNECECKGNIYENPELLETNDGSH